MLRRRFVYTKVAGSVVCTCDYTKVAGSIFVDTKIAGSSFVLHEDRRQFHLHLRLHQSRRQRFVYTKIAGKQQRYDLGVGRSGTKVADTTFVCTKVVDTTFVCKKVGTIIRPQGHAARSSARR